MGRKASIVQLAAGDDFFIALASDGRVFSLTESCVDGDKDSPKLVDAVRDVAWVGAGNEFALALDDEGLLYVLDCVEIHFLHPSRNHRHRYGAGAR